MDQGKPGKKTVLKLGDGSCPHCLRPNNSMTGAGMPDEGDFSVCATCRKVAVIELSPMGEISLRKASPDELVTFVKAELELAQMLAEGGEHSIANAIRRAQQ
jgi:hypothetical protein